MKRILITGATGYIGANVERYLMEYNAREGYEHYRVDRLFQRDAFWENYDFSPYDTILHLVGKAHVDIGNVTESVKQEYYDINCEMAVRTAAKAKAQGVPQFVYMSSVIVYGNSANVGGTKHITADTKPAPANFYGDSKWQAEQQLRELEDSNFKVAIVRSPMVYGKDSKGNFPLLVKLVGKTPVFPMIENKRSMIFIEHLAEFLRLLTDCGRGGTYLPQNDAYVTTAEMVRAIGAAKGKKIRLLKSLNFCVKVASLVPGKIGDMVNKAFGSLTIDTGLRTHALEKDEDGSLQTIGEYQLYSFEQTMQKSI